jgi:membrane protease YdiL (CAAX protease family)
MLYTYLLTLFYSDGATHLQEGARVIVQSHQTLKVAYIITAIFVAAVFEEVFFRGILFPFIVRNLGLWSGITMVSSIFALIHLNALSLLPLFMLSVVLCLAYWRTGSLWVSIGIHAIFNSVAIYNLLH